ncbi:50S ribosomal protein L1, partial [Bacillus sp. D-CC]
TFCKVSAIVAKFSTNLASSKDTLPKVKPAAAKGTYMKNVTVASTMGPGVRVDVSTLA